MKSTIADKILSKSPILAHLVFSIILLVFKFLLRRQARLHPSFKDRIKEKKFTTQIKLQDNSVGRYFTFRDGKIISKKGIHPRPDISMTFRSADIAVKLLIILYQLQSHSGMIFRSIDIVVKLFMPPHDQLAMINAMKNFLIGFEGPEELSSWFMETLSLMLNAGVRYGIDIGKGVTRYTSNSNGGPVFVYVKDGKIIRITPIEFDKKDAKPWTIKARGKTFTPPRRTTISPHTQVFKSMIYSPDRILYPMKRVDFNPNGKRNPKNRGVSGYERISWDEALDIVANEIKRVKKEYGPGAILNGSGSHHLWGILGY